MQTWNNILLVGIGGFAGSVLRYASSLLVKHIGWEFKWPLATFSVNLIGSLLIGMLWGWAAQQDSSRTLLLLGIAGFCGGFTTFSAFSFEVVGWLRGGDYALALGYVLVSVVLCVAGAWAGFLWTSK